MRCQLASPHASAVVFKKGEHVIAKKWDENHERWKRIARGKAGVDDAEVIQKAHDKIPKGVIHVRDITTTITTRNIQLTKDGITLVLDNCSFTLGDNVNKNVIVVKANTMIIARHCVFDGNKDNNTYGSAIYAGNPDRDVKFTLDGHNFEAKNFYDMGFNFVGNVKYGRTTIVHLTGDFKLHNNGKAGAYFGYNCHVYHSGLIEAYDNGGVSDHQGVCIGDGEDNRIILDKVKTYGTSDSTPQLYGVGIWKCRYVKINNLETYSNLNIGLLIERSARNIEIDWIYSHDNINQDGIYLINGTANPDGSKKKVFIKGLLENNGRSGIRIRSDSIDLEEIHLDVIARNNGAEGISIDMPSGYVFKNSIIKFLSEGNASADVITDIDKSTVIIIANGWRNSGSAKVTGNGTDTTFTVDITHGLVKDKAVAKITLDREGTVDKVYLVDKDGDGFKETLRVVVTYATAPADGEEVPIYWEAEVVS